MNQNIWSLIGFAAVALIVVGGLAFLSQHYTLDNIKSKTVGDGQYGTARWATKREIQKTYRHVPFQPELWRKGEHLPRQQGLVLGSLGRKNHVTALVDCDDIHCLMIGASGVGKSRLLSVSEFGICLCQRHELSGSGYQGRCDTFLTEKVRRGAKMKFRRLKGASEQVS